MKTKWNWIVILSMMMGLVFDVPVQPVSAQASATADFKFGSSPNPSNYGQEVSFTLAATGSDSTTYPPFGYVEFRDNGVAIPGCGTVPLNYPSSNPTPGYPAICTTSSLAVGTHTITAAFESMIPDDYADATLTLAGDQTVNDAITLTIYPSELLDAMLTKSYQIPLTAYYPGGSECTNCTWYATLGDLPDGIGINGSTGMIQGTPTTIGDYSFTIIADDGNGARGTRAYTMSVTKVKTVVDVGTSTIFVGSTAPTTLGATARHPDPSYSPRPTGKISFSVAGVPVPGCSGADALSTNQWGQAYCTSYVPTGLATGDYQIQAEFTPDVASSGVYLGATGTGTLQVNIPQASVSGRVFMDDNQNGMKDEMEVAQGNWYVFLNQDCDDFLDWNTVTNPSTGGFSFENVPTDHEYCLFVDLSTYSGYVQTTPYNNLTLSGNEYFEIGVYYPHISILPTSEESLRGSVGTFFEQTFQISGGTQPYTVELSSSESYPLQAGLSFDAATHILSGTPTVGGAAQFDLSVVDSDGLTAEKTYWLLVQSEGEFYLTSSANPSSPGQEVTFSLTGYGDAVDPQFGPVPPFGFVTFYDGDMPIAGCEESILNIDLEMFEIGNYPATCTTSALTEGQHTIKAFFTFPDGMYSDATRTLTQMVGAVSSLAISTEMLPHAEYQTPYSQQLTASGGTESYSFSLVGGALPSGISLSSDGLLSGFADHPAAPGTYPIAIQVLDANGDTASRDYNFVLDKGAPEVTAKADSMIYWHHPFTVWAEALKKISEGSYAVLDGTVAFFIDGTAVLGCEAVTEANGYYLCPGVSMDLAVGTHTLTADFTPTGWHTGYYTAGSDSSEFTVQPSLANFPGMVFLDANQDGVWDEGESRINASDWTINLDQGCDETVDYSSQPVNGFFNFVGIPVSGQCHRITVDGTPGYQQTTQLEDSVPEPGTAAFIEVGFYYPTIILSPSEYELPSGTVGVEYSQTFSASGGTEPYTYSIDSTRSDLPDGLTLSADGVLSGTPTSSGTYSFTVRAEDATGAIGQKYYQLTIERVKIDGDFTFTSSSNPSAPGEAVTFTVSATGNVVIPDFGAIPPIGLVTFSADETPIEGCSDLYLNLQIDENGNPIIGNFPATCTTAALGEGSHQIVATYYDFMGTYNEPSLVLTQVVSAPVSADLTIENVDSKDPVKPNSKLVYTLTVRNLGPDLAEGVTVTDKLDVTTTFVSVSTPKGWACTYAEKSGLVTCSSDSLAGGSSAIIKITVMVNKTATIGKDLVNNASVSSTTFDPDLANNAAAQKTLVLK